MNPEYPVLDLKEVYNVSAVNWFKIIMTVIGVVGVLLSLLTLFIVCTKSPAIMNKFKTYLLLYTFCSFLIELVILLGQPVILPVYLIIYPHGLLSPVNALTMKILIFLLLSSAVGAFICFLCMIIERFTAISNLMLSTVHFYQNPNTYVYACLCGFIYVTVSVTLFFISISLNQWNILRILFKLV